jgi:hypothetical protein
LNVWLQIGFQTDWFESGCLSLYFSWLRLIIGLERFCVKYYLLMDERILLCWMFCLWCSCAKYQRKVMFTSLACLKTIWINHASCIFKSSLFISSSYNALSLRADFFVNVDNECKVMKIQFFIRSLYIASSPRANFFVNI